MTVKYEQLDKELLEQIKTLVTPLCERKNTKQNRALIYNRVERIVRAVKRERHLTCSWVCDASNNPLTAQQINFEFCLRTYLAFDYKILRIGNVDYVNALYDFSSSASESV